MTALDTPTDRLPAELRGPVRQYADLVRGVGGLNARGLALYGAAAAGPFDPREDTIQSVLVLDAVDLAALRRLAAHGPVLGKLHIAAPLILTPRSIRDSLDSFPLQLLEIQQAHLTVFGDDYFANLAFDAAHLRLRCEYALRGLLLEMNQALLTAAGREEFVDAIEAGVSATLLRTLRGMLWLKGQRRAQPAADVIAETERVIARPLPGVRLAIRRRVTHDWGHFESLYRDVEKLAEVVNDW